MDLSSEALGSPPMPAPFVPIVEEAVPPRRHTASPTVLRQPSSPAMLRTSRTKGPRLVVRILGARALTGTPDPVVRVWCGRIDATHIAEDQAQETTARRQTREPSWDAGNEFCFALQLNAPEDLSGGCCVVSLHDDRRARATGDRHRAALGEAIVPLRDVFARGRADSEKQAVHLSATWFPLTGRSPGQTCCGDVLVSFSFSFGEVDDFDEAIQAILGVQADMRAPPSPTKDMMQSPPAWSRRPVSSSLSPIRERSQDDALDYKVASARGPREARSPPPSTSRTWQRGMESARSRARSSADFSGASARVVAMNRLKKAAKIAEDSLLQHGNGSRVRDRARGHLALLRDKDRRPAACGLLWDEVQRVCACEDPKDTLALFEEVLGLRATARAEGRSSAVLLDDAAPLAARKQCLLVIGCLARARPDACASRLAHALRACADVAQGAEGSGSALSQVAAVVAGGVARHVFPRAAAARADAEEAMTFPVDVLIAPFTLVLARPQARGRRFVAHCLAAVLRAEPGPRNVWLDADSRLRLATPHGLLEDLKRRCALRGVALPGAITALPGNRGVVIHCEDDGQARDLRVNLANVLPPGWRLSDGPDDGGETDNVQRAAFALAVAPGSAPVCSWVVEACRSHQDALEPFCDAAAALLRLRDDAKRLATLSTSDFDPRVVAQADAALAEGLKAAAPALARHAARCVEGAGNASRDVVGQLAWRDKASALDLVAALAASKCARDAVAPLRRPLEAACDVATHHAVKPVRVAAGRALDALRQLRATVVPKRQQRTDRDVCASLASRMSVAGFYAPPPPPETHLSPAHFGDFCVPEAGAPAGAPVPKLSLPCMAEPPAPAPTPAWRPERMASPAFASDLLDDDELPPWRRPRRRKMKRNQPFFRPFAGGGDDFGQASSAVSLAPLEPLQQSVDALAMRCEKVERALRDHASAARAPLRDPQTRAPAPAPRVEREAPPATSRASQQTRKVWGEAARLMQGGDLDAAFRRAAADPRAFLGLLAKVPPAALAVDVEALVLNFAARAFARSDAWPRPLLAWLAADPAKTQRSVGGRHLADLLRALTIVASEPTPRGVEASGLLRRLGG